MRGLIFYYHTIIVFWWLVHSLMVVEPRIGLFHPERDLFIKYAQAHIVIALQAYQFTGWNLFCFPIRERPELDLWWNDGVWPWGI